MADAPLTPLHRNPDYQRLWLAHALSAFGSQATYLALPLVLLAATHSITDFGVVTFAEIVSSLFASFPAGVLVDRLRRRTVLLVCDLARAVSLALFAAVVLADRVSLPLAVAVAVLNSVLSAPFGPAASAALRHVVPRSQLTTAVSMAQARSAVATLAGPMLGAALYAVTPVLPFVVDAASFAASALCVLAVRLPKEPPRTGPAKADRPPFLRDLTTGLVEVRRSAFLRYTLVNAALVNFVFSGIVVVLVAQGAESPSGSYHNGVIIAMSGAGNLIGALFSARAGRTLAPRTLVLAVCWSTALLTPFLALDGGVALTALLIGLCSLSTPAANAVISAARLHSVPDHLLGRVQTACGIAPALFVPFGPLASGVLLDHFAASTVLLLNAALLLALAAYSTLSTGLRHIPDLRAPSPRSRPELPRTKTSSATA
ncbi:MFS transporter [Streptomyces sp. TLI_171]|uniref:MFS transporter n=1 Tax=Streptomyces sp. TLI_171 TaxID=1938859 RepID=UPI000C190E33|nr:MFS transporter [Streptomyces sp. TLI_171]RKE22475.1 putative MFS family arabinose efflux permease [Streptomyces sp. TLI_171]